MPLQATSGAASYDAFGGGVAAVPNYIEDVFATHLYTGNGSTQTISNGIDLSTKGGLVWIKSRNQDAGNLLSDTSQGTTKFLISNTTGAQQTDAGGVTAFNSNGFSLGSSSGFNGNTYSQVSWTFRKQPKFFDIVTYTGDGTNSNRRISHNLGSVPGCIIVKRTNSTSDWVVYHRSLPATTTNRFLMLNSTAAYDTSADIWGTAAPTSTDFGVGNSSVKQNLTGATYVCYLFAHDAGGFGLTGTDNVISCGSLTHASGTADSISLGYEPQWLLIKRTDSALDGSWYIFDTMRGFTTYGVDDNFLLANLSNAEDVLNAVAPTATGFQFQSGMTTGTYIYIAIRRGPMKVPTDATKVFIPTYGDNNAVAPAFVTNFPVDLGVLGKSTTGATLNRWTSRLTETLYLDSPSTAAEVTGTAFKFDFQNGWVNSTINYTSAFSWNFRRAPSFFDEVCYTGTGSGSTQITHNLQAIPELVICKSRSSAINWSIACNVGGMNYVRGLASAFGFNSTNAATQTVDFTGVISSTYFKPTTIYGAADDANQSGVTYVAYLFATCAGVSKVGSYTGTATTLQINCGFTSGARFVLIKRTDSTGGWYVWDSARGIVSGNDPYLLLNSTAAEVTITDYIDTYSAGFELSTTAAATVNVLNGTYIYLAIA